MVKKYNVATKSADKEARLLLLSDKCRISSLRFGGDGAGGEGGGEDGAGDDGGGIGDGTGTYARYTVAAAKGCFGREGVEEFGDGVEARAAPTYDVGSGGTEGFVTLGPHGQAAAATTLRAARASICTRCGPTRWRLRSTTPWAMRGRRPAM